MSFAWRIAFGAALAIAIPLVFALLISINHRAYVRRLHEVLEPDQSALARTTYLERLAIDMETGIRGFRQTGEERFLEPYETAVSKYPSVVGELRRRLDTPRERQLFKDVTGALETWRTQYAEPSICISPPAPRPADRRRDSGAGQSSGARSPRRQAPHG